MDSRMFTLPRECAYRSPVSTSSLLGWRVSTHCRGVSSGTHGQNATCGTISVHPCHRSRIPAAGLGANPTGPLVARPECSAEQGSPSAGANSTNPLEAGHFTTTRRLTMSNTSVMLPFDWRTSCPCKPTAHSGLLPSPVRPLPVRVDTRGARFNDMQSADGSNRVLHVVYSLLAVAGWHSRHCSVILCGRGQVAVRPQVSTSIGTIRGTTRGCRVSLAFGDSAQHLDIPTTVAGVYRQTNRLTVFNCTGISSCRGDRGRGQGVWSERNTRASDKRTIDRESAEVRDFPCVPRCTRGEGWVQHAAWPGPDVDSIDATIRTGAPEWGGCSLSGQDPMDAGSKTIVITASQRISGSGLALLFAHVRKASA